MLPTLYWTAVTEKSCTKPRRISDFHTRFRHTHPCNRHLHHYRASKREEGRTRQSGASRTACTMSEMSKTKSAEKQVEEPRRTKGKSVFGRATCLDAVLLYFEIKSFRRNTEDLCSLESVPLVGLQDFLDVDLLYFIEREKPALRFC
jgi:hypothetical protein